LIRHIRIILGVEHQHLGGVNLVSVVPRIVERL
jgi:hypothetical protein